MTDVGLLAFFVWCGGFGYDSNLGSLKEPQLRQRCLVDRYQEDSARSKDQINTGFECVGGHMADEAVALLRDFYAQGNPNGESGLHH